jgi:hypothetical protein
MQDNKHKITIVSICEDPEGGWDITCQFRGREIYFWSNYSCTELEVVGAHFIFVKTRDRVMRILNGVFDCTFVERNLIPKTYDV